MRKSREISRPRLLPRPCALSNAACSSQRPVWSGHSCPPRLRARHLGRSAERNHAEIQQHHRRVRPRVHSPLLLRRHARRPQWRLHGPPLLPPLGRVATGTHDLLIRGGRRNQVGAWCEAGHRTGAVCALTLHPCLGLEHSRQQRSPLALHRRSSSQRCEAGRH